MVQIIAAAVAIVMLTVQTDLPAQPAPLLDNLDLMDMLVKPAYDELRQAMTSAPADRKAWASLYQRAARLTEIENLLFLRTRAADDRRPEWAQRAAQARQASADVAGAALIGLRNAGAEDFQAVRSRFPSVAAGCNACHRAFSREAPSIRP